MRSDSAEALKAAIPAGLAIPCFSFAGVEPDLRRKNLAVIRTGGPRLVRELVFLKLRSGYTPKVVLELGRMAKELHWRKLEPIRKAQGS